MIGNQNTGLLKQIACLTEVATKTGFTVFDKCKLSVCLAFCCHIFSIHMVRTYAVGQTHRICFNFSCLNASAHPWLQRNTNNELEYNTTNKMTVRPAKTQISLGIRPVWSEPSPCTQWVVKDQSFLHADSEDSDQNGQMPRLIWVFPGRTCHFVGFVMRQLKWPGHPAKTQISLSICPVRSVLAVPEERLGS